MENTIYKLYKELASERRSIILIEPIMFDLKSTINIADEIFYNILIAVTEAVNNAIIHGNRCIPEKSVKLLIEADSSNLEITVSDDGDGFDPAKIPDPRNEENLLKESGRGVFLIRSLSRELYFHPVSKGTMLTMKFDYKS